MSQMVRRFDKSIHLKKLIVKPRLPTGNGNGCEWSGCREFATTPCKTGVTGGSGRHNLYRTKSCGFFGRKDFCCDDDCGYVECGTVTFGTKYTNEVARMQCGVASQQSFKEFVCGTNGVLPLGVSVSGRRVNGFRDNSGDGSTFRASDNSGEINNDGFRMSNGGGFRTGSETSNDATGTNNGGNFRSSGNGFRT